MIVCRLRKYCHARSLSPLTIARIPNRVKGVRDQTAPPYRRRSREPAGSSHYALQPVGGGRPVVGPPLGAQWPGSHAGPLVSARGATSGGGSPQSGESWRSLGERALRLRRREIAQVVAELRQVRPRLAPIALPTGGSLGESLAKTCERAHSRQGDCSRGQWNGSRNSQSAFNRWRQTVAALATSAHKLGQRRRRREALKWNCALATSRRETSQANGCVLASVTMQAFSGSGCQVWELQRHRKPNKPSEWLTEVKSSARTVCGGCGGGGGNASERRC